MTKMSATKIGLTLVVALAALTPSAAHPSPSERACSRACRNDLAAARAATSAYLDPLASLADGFVPRECTGSTDGAQGEHWTRPDRLADRTTALDEPEMLLYMPSDEGRRLVALEWAVAVFDGDTPYYGSEPPDPERVGPPPVLFGRIFDGPMRGHHPGEPWHYDLHVWAWELNPAGLFAPENPNLRCP